MIEAWRRGGWSPQVGEDGRAWRHRLCQRPGVGQATAGAMPGCSLGGLVKYRAPFEGGFKGLIEGGLRAVIRYLDVWGT